MSAIFCLNHSPCITVPNKFTKGPLSVIIPAINEDFENAWAQISVISGVLYALLVVMFASYW